MHTVCVEPFLLISLHVLQQQRSVFDQASVLTASFSLFRPLMVDTLAPCHAWPGRCRIKPKTFQAESVNNCLSVVSSSAHFALFLLFNVMLPFYEDSIAAPRTLFQVVCSPLPVPRNFSLFPRSALPLPECPL